MTTDTPTHVTVLVTDEQMAELREWFEEEPGVTKILPVETTITVTDDKADPLRRLEIPIWQSISEDRDPLRTALAFYADFANWSEGVGTGPNRPAPCVADGGAMARAVLKLLEVSR